VERFSDSAVRFFGTRSAKFQVIWICKFAGYEQKSEMVASVRSTVITDALCHRSPLLVFNCWL